MIPEVPELLTERLLMQYGEALTADIVAGFAQRRPVTLRVNTLKASDEEILSELEQHGIVAQRVSWYQHALILPDANEAMLEALPMYTDGRIYLQSLSAMLPVLMLAPDEKDSILDMAAAPGGKTTQMAMETNGKASITACERDARRCERLRFNLERQGARRVQVMNRDARQLDDFFSFSSILLDAPCSGSGTLLLLEGEPQRRMTPDWLRKITVTQRGMLQKAFRLLQKGRRMVYSTCSILQEENEAIVRPLIESGAARLIPIDAERFAGVPQLTVTMQGTMCVKPDELYEGFYCAVLEKIK